MTAEWWSSAVIPFIFKIERIDIPEYEEEKLWLEKQNFKNMADDAYTGWQLQAYQYDKIGNYFDRIIRKKFPMGDEYSHE